MLAGETSWPPAGIGSEAPAPGSLPIDITPIRARCHGQGHAIFQMTVYGPVCECVAAQQWLQSRVLPHPTQLPSLPTTAEPVERKVPSPGVTTPPTSTDTTHAPINGAARSRADLDLQPSALAKAAELKPLLDALGKVPLSKERRAFLDAFRKQRPAEALQHDDYGLLYVEAVAAALLTQCDWPLHRLLEDDP